MLYRHTSAGQGVALAVTLAALVAALVAPRPVSATACDAFTPCANGACCSKFGFCGYTSDHCLPSRGCLSQCDQEEEGPAGGGLCGPTSPCPSGHCCSKWGQCGSSPDHCLLEAGCTANCTMTCGDGVCNGDETCYSCQDCGECPVPLGSIKRCLPPGTITLTFDDGPESTNTPKILDILARRGVKAIFYVLGERLTWGDHADILRRIVREGHEVGVHSWTHDDYTLKNKEQIREDLRKSVYEVQKIAGVRPRFFRPPYGALNDLVIETVEDFGMSVVHYSTDTRDWAYSAGQEAEIAAYWRGEFNFRAPHGQIHLQHDTLAHSVPVTDLVLDHILNSTEAKGYRIVSQQECIYPVQTCNSTAPCPDASCCSKDGYCGTTGHHCLASRGCQSNISCGDGSCNGAETCEDCAQDCGVCPDAARVHRACTGEREIALTYSDGPMSPYTDRLLDYAKDLNVPLSFFVHAERLDQGWTNHSSVAKRMASEGHAVLSQTYTMKSALTAMDNATIRYELNRAAVAIEDATGLKPRFLRPPYGEYDARVQEIAQMMGYELVLWNVDPEDHRYPGDSDRVVEQTTAQTDALAPHGAIAVLHDTHLHSVNAFPRVVAALRAKNYKIVTMDQCLRAVERCGPSQRCSSGQCCSKNGYCGTENSHCLLSEGCQADCREVCGDGVCNGQETTATCSADCGSAPSPSGVVYGCTIGRRMMLAFGTVPHHQFTPPLLATLAAEQAPSTFFVTTNRLEWGGHDSLARQIAAEGHTVASATHSRTSLTTLSESQIRDELTASEAALDALNMSPAQPRIMQPPFGETNADVIATVEAMGYRMVRWNVDPRDWANGATPQSIADAVYTGLMGLKGAGAISAHSGGTLTGINAIPEVINATRRAGYRLVNWDGCTEQCQSPCVRCESEATYCTACAAGSFAYLGACLSACPAGHFGNAATGACEPCDASCETCSGTATTCTSCKNGNVLNGAVCGPSCSSGSFPLSGVCTTCDSSCLECTGTGASNCYSCKSDANLYNGQCLAQCPDGTYLDTAARVCRACNGACSTCTGAGAGDCTACAESGKFLHSGSCVASCPSKTYADSSTRHCSPCAVECSGGCTGAANTTCSGCAAAAGTFLHSSTCTSECPLGTYARASDRTCVNCPAGQNCAGCGESADGLKVFCTSCPSSHRLYNGNCVASCPAGTLDRGTSCDVCNDDCQTCQGTTDTCTSCPAGKVSYGSTCVTPCPAAHTRVAGACVPCGVGCSACFGSASNCTACASQYLQSGQSCVSQCQSNQFVNNNACVDCDSTCATCSGSGAAQCRTCATGRFLHAGTCVVTCPSGYFNDDVSGECRQCDTNCVCTNDANTCASCTGGLKLYGTQCVGSCPGGTYEAAGKCEACHADCALCNSGLASNCTSCAGGRVLHAGSCVDQAPSGYYNRFGTTAKCSEQCAECAGSAEQCTKCPSGERLLGSNCFVDCPAGSIVNGTAACVECDDTCATCTRTPSQCLSCASPDHAFDAATSSCNSTCPEGKYAKNGECTSCRRNWNCATCADTRKCLTCPAGRGLYNGRCLSACPHGYHNKDGVCTRCEPRSVCQRCSSETVCTRCRSGYTLESYPNGAANCTRNCKSDQVNIDNNCEYCAEGCSDCDGSTTNCVACRSNFYLSGDNTCVRYNAIPAGYYGDKSTRTLVKCSDDCATCAQYGPADQCTSCPAGRRLHDGNCWDECPSSTFASGADACGDCHWSCVSCTSTSSAACLSCNYNSTQPRYLYNSRCSLEKHIPKTHYLEGGVAVQCPSACRYCSDAQTCTDCPNGKFLLNGQCVAACPAGMYGSGRRCLACASGCKTCSSSTKCTSCPTGQSLSNNQCVSDCPAGRTPVNGVCTRCKHPCKECSPGNTATCTACHNKWSMDGQTCVRRCAAGKVSEVINGTATCVPCDPELQCRTCNPDSSTCSSCLLGSYLHNGTCGAECPEGKYGHARHRKCYNCHKHCETCSGRSSHCTSCPDGRFLFGKSCRTSCPHGYVGNGANVCVKCQDPCDRCDGSPTTCTRCDLGTWLHNGTCTTNCPAGTYRYGSRRGVCRPCRSECSTCKSWNHCTSCPEHLALSSNGRVCQDSCNADQVEINNQCHKCTNNCKTCGAGKTDHCLSCGGSRGLLNNECVHPCPQGRFLHQNTCLQCSGNCLTCSKNETHCTSCGGDEPYLDTSEAGIARCYDVCPLGMYGSNGRCRSCHSTCESCSGSGSRRCLTCPEGRVQYQSECRTSCPHGTYDNDGICEACDEACSRCGPDAVTCSHCAKGYVLNGTRCYDECPHGTYLPRGRKACEACNDECASCAGAAGKCTSCAAPLYLLGQNCVRSCPEGNTMDNTNRTCVVSHAADSIKALSFGGESSEVQLGAINPGPVFTVELRMMQFSNNGIRNIINAVDSTSAYNSLYLGYRDRKKFILEVNQRDVWEYNSCTEPNAGCFEFPTERHRLYDIAIRVTPEAAELFVDGVQIGAVALTAGPPRFGANVQWSVGRDTNRHSPTQFTSNKFHGLINHIRIWGGYRSDAAIADAFAHVVSGTEKGLLASWDMQQPSSDTTLYDSVTKAARGQLTGFGSSTKVGLVPSPFPRLMAHGNAVSFPGRTDGSRVSLGALQPGAELTISMHVKFEDNLNSYRTLLEAVDTASAKSVLYIGNMRGRWLAVVNDDTYYEGDSCGRRGITQVCPSTSAAITDRPYHVVVTVGADGLAMYVDGQLMGTSALMSRGAPVFGPGVEWTLGADTDRSPPQWTSDPHQGTVWDVRVFRGVRAPTDISAGMYAHWPMTEQPGSTKLEDAAGAHDATLYGSAEVVVNDIRPPSLATPPAPTASTLAFHRGGPLEKRALCFSPTSPSSEEQYGRIGAFNPGRSFTFEARVSLSNPSKGIHSIVEALAPNSAKNAFYLGYSNGRIFAEFNDRTSTEGDSCRDTKRTICHSFRPDIDAAFWVAVTVQSDRAGDKAKLFINGDEAASLDLEYGAPAFTNDTVWVLGADTDRTPHRWNSDKLLGCIGDVRVWAGSRDASLIKYHAKHVIDIASDGGLRLWLPGVQGAAGPMEDLSEGNAHSAALVGSGASLKADVFGRLATPAAALRFNGKNNGGVVELGQLSPGGVYTVEAVVQWDAVSYRRTRYAIVEAVDTTTAKNAFFMGYVDGNWQVTLDDSTVWEADTCRMTSDFAVCTAFQAKAGVPYHVVAVVGPTDVRMYVDGVLVGRRDKPSGESLGVAGAHTTWAIGKDSDRPRVWTDNSFNGHIGEVRVWDIARSADDIKSSRYTPLTGSEPGLYAYYPIREPRGAVTIRDHQAKARFPGRLSVFPAGYGVTRSPFPLVAPAPPPTPPAPTHSLPKAVLFSASAPEGMVSLGALEPGASFTVEAWVQPGREIANNRYHTIIEAVDEKTSKNALYLGYVKGRMQVEINDNTVWEGDSCGSSAHPRLCKDTTLEAGTAFHVAVAVTPQSIRLYMNGQLLASTTMATPVNAAFGPQVQWVLGRDSDRVPLRFTSDALDGYIRDVRVWSTNRNDNAIADGRQQALTGAEPYLYAWYSMLGVDNWDSNILSNGATNSPAGNAYISGGRLEDSPFPAPGQPRRSILFSGATGKGHVELPSALAGRMAQSSRAELTVEMWAQFSRLDKYRTLFEIAKAADGKNALYIGHVKGKMQIEVNDRTVTEGDTCNNQAGYALCVDVGMAASEATHIAVVLTGTEAILYINGDESGRGSHGGFPQLSVDDAWVLGADTDRKKPHRWNSDPMAGYIAEVRVWSTARSGADIKASMRKHLAPLTAGLAAYYPITDAVGATTILERAGTGVGAAKLVDFDSGYGVKDGPFDLATVSLSKFLGPATDSDKRAVLSLGTGDTSANAAVATGRVELGHLFPGRVFTVESLMSLTTPKDGRIHTLLEVVDTTTAKNALWIGYRSGQLRATINDNTVLEGDSCVAATDMRRNALCVAAEMQANTIYHVAVTVTTSSLTLWLNYEVVGSRAITASPAFSYNTLWVLGADTDQTPARFSSDRMNGYIYDLRLWSEEVGPAKMGRALSGDETGLYAWWPMADAVGADTIRDRSKSGRYPGHVISLEGEQGLVEVDVGGAPAPVRQVTKSSDGSTLTLAWTAPAVTYGRQADLRYVVSYSTGGSVAGTVHAGATPSAAISESALTSGQDYEFAVTSFFQPDSSNSSVVLAYVAFGKCPGAVENVGVEEDTSSVHVTWSPPKDALGDYSYDVVYSTSSDLSSPTVAATGTATRRVTIDRTSGGIAWGVEYFYGVRLNSNGCTGSYSSTRLTSKSTPGEPRKVIVKKTDTDITISWQAPRTGQAPFSYTVEYSTDSTFSSGAVTDATNGTTTNTEATIARSTLATSTQYYARITPQNADGTGPARVARFYVETTKCPSETPKRCASGCAAADASCPATSCAAGQTACPDGTCAATCQPYDGCPVGMIICADGKCRSSLDACARGCAGGMQRCFDGSCAFAADCTTPPHQRKPQDSSAELNDGADTSVDMTDSSGSSLGSVTIPANALDSASGLQLSVSSVMDSEIPSDSGDTSSLVSSVVDLKLTATTDGSTEVSKTFASRVSVGLACTLLKSASEYCFSYVDSTGAWACESEITVAEGATTICSGDTGHFTTFGIVEKTATSSGSGGGDNTALIASLSSVSAVLLLLCPCVACCVLLCGGGSLAAVGGLVARKLGMFGSKDKGTVTGATPSRAPRSSYVRSRDDESDPGVELTEVTPQASKSGSLDSSPEIMGSRRNSALTLANPENRSKLKVALSDLKYKIEKPGGGASTPGSQLARTGSSMKF